MADNLLYFPYINLPKTDWTLRTLLYYDKVGAIVPSDFFYEPERNYEPFMLDLVKKELVIPINPVDHLEHPFELNKPFLDFVNSRDFQIEIRREAFNYQLNPIHGPIISRQLYEESPARVSGQKFNDELIRSLVELGLAKHSNKEWYFMEIFTANYLMAYLATTLAEKLKMLATTDTEFSYLFRQVGRNQNESYQKNWKRENILKELIPMPVEINLTKVQNFKDKNLTHLKRFQNLVEQIALNPIYDDDKLLDEKIKELMFEKEQLTVKMNETNFGSIFFGTACGIFGAFQGLAQANTESAFWGSIPGFASAIYSALKIQKAEATFDQTGLKYLSLLDKRVRVKS